ncbi:MAG: hypothetical protein ACRYFX_08735 [Janthinobacterium lividum]
MPAATLPPIPFYVTPYYNSEGPEINVGPLSPALLYATPDSIGAIAEAIGGAQAY